MERINGRKRGFGWLIGIFAVYGSLLIWGGWYASGIAPKLMSRNYQSIQYASSMESALVSIFLDAANGKESAPADVKHFEESLTAAKGNITEVREPEILNQLTLNWNEFRKNPVTPAGEAFKKVAASINDLTAVNEDAMKSFENTAVTLRYTFIVGGVMGLFLVLLYAVQIALSVSFEEKA